MNPEHANRQDQPDQARTRDGLLRRNAPDRQQQVQRYASDCLCSPGVGGPPCRRQRRTRPRAEGEDMGLFLCHIRTHRVHGGR